MADILIDQGYAAAGYNFVNVDDCWLEKERNVYGELVPDRERFPGGMKALADYVSILKSFYNFQTIQKMFSTKVVDVRGTYATNCHMA